MERTFYRVLTIDCTYRFSLERRGRQLFLLTCDVNLLMIYVCD